jgi:hypothetical protein
MRLPAPLPLHLPSRPILSILTLSLPQCRQASDQLVVRSKSTGWSKNAGNKKKSAAATGSSNPFLQGMNFDRGDARVGLARQILFSQRPLRGLRLNPQDQIRHETIHRAWLLFQSRRRREKLRRLSILQNSLVRTMKFLRETDENLYGMAVSGSRETEKRFPLVMRIPTNTLPSKWWNYNWTAANIKGAGGVAKPG